MCGVRGLFSSGSNCSGEVLRLLTKKLEMAYNFSGLRQREERVAERKYLGIFSPRFERHKV